MQSALDKPTQSVVVSPCMKGVDILDFPFVLELPKREVKRVRTVWDELQEIADLVKEKGPPVPVSMCALALGVSRQRVYDYIKTGRLETMEYGGVVHVTKRSLYDFAQLERTNGRPTGGGGRYSNE